MLRPTSIRRRRDAFPPWFNPSLLCQRSKVPTLRTCDALRCSSRAAHGRRFAPQHERCDFFIRFSRWVALTQVARAKTLEDERRAQRIKPKNSAFDAINAGMPEGRRTFA